VTPVIGDFNTVYFFKSNFFKIIPIRAQLSRIKYEGWNFNSGNYLFTTDTK